MIPQPVMAAAVPKSPETPFRILMDEEDEPVVSPHTPKRSIEEDDSRFFTPPQENDEDDEFARLTSTQSPTSEVEVSLPIEDGEPEEEDWASDISKALSLIEDATQVNETTTT